MSLTVSSGLRLRLVRDSLLAFLDEGLGALGWFDANRRHQPVVVLPEPLESQPIEPNMIALSVETSAFEHIEVGSNLTDDAIACAFELYAESTSLGDHLAHDMRDLFRGRLGTGRGRIPIWDYAMATPAMIASAGVEALRLERNSSPSREAWQAHWYTLRLELHDAYYEPGPQLRTATTPGPDVLPGDDLFPSTGSLPV